MEQSPSESEGIVVPVLNQVPCHEDLFIDQLSTYYSALDGGEWSPSHPGCFTSRKRAPGAHWIGGWVGHRAGVDAVVKRKYPHHYQKLNPSQPTYSLVTIKTSLPWLQKPQIYI